jgi:bacillithiol system protein YtxJ
MNWIQLNKEEQIANISEESKAHPVLIFKHSTRCSISQTALNRFERNWKPDEMPSVKTYFLDLISYRTISNQVAEYFNVEHESPQILLLENSNPTLVRSHMSIDANEIKERLSFKN